MDLFLLIAELVGTVSFAASGALLGLKKNMDIFGVAIMGVITACGGGILRDLFLGQLPPVMFREPVYALTAVGVSILLFLPGVQRVLVSRERAYEIFSLVTDAAGLGVFTAAGVSAAFSAGYGDNLFFVVFLGSITGVGGGVMRDLLAGDRPYIFVKHIYALASVAGAILCGALWNITGDAPAMICCFGLVFLIRLLAAHFRWSLPKAHLPQLPGEN